MKTATIEPTREAAFAKMRAALETTCGDLYDDATLDLRANALLNSLLLRGAVVIREVAK
jgi:hypothetical protein